jgi:hypothetical protein
MIAESGEGGAGVQSRGGTGRIDREGGGGTYLPDIGNCHGGYFRVPHRADRPTTKRVILSGSRRCGRTNSDFDALLAFLFGIYCSHV